MNVGVRTALLRRDIRPVSLIDTNQHAPIPHGSKTGMGGMSGQYKRIYLVFQAVKWNGAIPKTLLHLEIAAWHSEHGIWKNRKTLVHLRRNITATTTPSKVVIIHHTFLET